MEEQALMVHRVGERSHAAAGDGTVPAKMGAVTTTLPTCHMVVLGEPAKVVAVIDEAARTVGVTSWSGWRGSHA